MRTPRHVLLSRSRTMRAQPTLTEEILWQVLRGSRLGVAFRRQAVIGRFIVDFVAPSIRLVVEVDGGSTTRTRRSCAPMRGGTGTCGVPGTACCMCRGPWCSIGWAMRLRSWPSPLRAREHESLVRQFRAYGDTEGDASQRGRRRRWGAAR